MNKDILYEILNSEYENLSSAEIEGILNEELDKSPEEMDTDLVELCLDALNSAGEKKLNKRRLRVRLSRILIAAVIFVLLIGIAIPVCAKYFSVSFSDGVVKFYDDCFSVDLSNNDYVQDLDGNLEQDGIVDEKLPDMLFQPETKVSNYICKDINGNSNINFEFQCGEIQGSVIIVDYEKSNDLISNHGKVNSKYKYVNKIDKGEFTVVIFSDDKESYLCYAYDGSEYSISLYCDYETAYKIAESL